MRSILPQSIFVALDVPLVATATDIITKLHGTGASFKVGPVLNMRYGDEVIKIVKSTGAKLFLDLKWANTPDVVKAAVETAADFGVDVCNIMLADNGPESISAAVEAIRGSMTTLLGVTVLTTRDKQSIEATGVVGDSVSEQVLRLAELAKGLGVHGVVASVHEIKVLRAVCGPNFKLMIPGIKLGDAVGGGQKRTSTPYQAFTDGADDIVVGTAIIKASDPREAFLKVLEDAQRAFAS